MGKWDLTESSICGDKRQANRLSMGQLSLFLSDSIERLALGRKPFVAAQTGSGGEDR